jgi:hypothetical protein
MAVTNPGTTLCSAMDASCVLVCSSTSCGQTSVLLQCAQVARICAGARSQHIVGSVWFLCFESLAGSVDFVTVILSAPPLSVACCCVCDAGHVGVLRVGPFLCSPQFQCLAGCCLNFGGVLGVSRVGWWCGCAVPCRLTSLHVAVHSVLLAAACSLLFGV